MSTNQQFYQHRYSDPTTTTRHTACSGGPISLQRLSTHHSSCGHYYICTGDGTHPPRVWYNFVVSFRKAELSLAWIPQLGFPPVLFSGKKEKTLVYNSYRLAPAAARFFYLAFSIEGAGVRRRQKIARE